MNQHQNTPLNALLDETVKLIDEYAPSPADQLGAYVDLWLQASRRAAGLKSRIDVLMLMERSAKRKDGVTYETQAKQAAEQLAPILEELETVTWQVVDILAESSTLRENVNNWLLFPRALRRMLQKGLASKGADVSAIMQSVELMEQVRP